MSIKQSLHQHEQQAKLAKEKALNKRQKPLVQEEVEKHWKTFMQEIIDKGNAMVGNMLLGRTLAVKDKNTVELHLINPLQESQFKPFLNDYLASLHESCENDFATLVFNIEVIEEGPKPVTPTDIFNELATKNPLLLQLKQKLDLELD